MPEVPSENKIDAVALAETAAVTFVASVEEVAFPANAPVVVQPDLAGEVIRQRHGVHLQRYPDRCLQAIPGYRDGAGVGACGNIPGDVDVDPHALPELLGYGVLLIRNIERLPVPFSGIDRDKSVGVPACAKVIGSRR